MKDPFKLLIVEDDPLVREMLTQRFERDGFEVAWARDGQEGLDLVESLQPDLIVTDIVMPKMSGTEMIAEIKKRQTGIKIIAISGGGRLGVNLPPLQDIEVAKILQLLDSSEEQGALMSLQKPFDPKDLSCAVGMLLADSKKRKALSAEKKVVE